MAERAVAVDSVTVEPVDGTVGEEGGLRVVAPGVGVQPPMLHLTVVVRGNGVAGASACLHGGLVVASGRPGGEPDEVVVDVPVMLLEPRFELSVDVFGAHGPIGTVRVDGSSGQVAVATAGRLRPLLVHQLGRGGTTALMRLLAAHPEIAVFDEYPLEGRLALTACHSLAVETGAYLPVEFPPLRFPDDEPAMRWNPFLLPWMLHSDAVRSEVYTAGLSALRTARVDLVESAYRTVAPQATYFAEKFQFESSGANVTQQTVLAAWPAAEQLLVMRDPRDLLCSRLAFNERRRRGSFELELDTTPDAAVDSVVRHVSIVAAQADAFPGAAIVGYEELVTRPVAVATRVFLRLGVSADHATVQAAVRTSTGGAAAHRTTASTDSSIGRWRRDLPAAVAGRLADELGDLMDRFGYR